MTEEKEKKAEENPRHPSQLAAAVLDHIETKEAEDGSQFRPDPTGAWNQIPTRRTKEMTAVPTPAPAPAANESDKEVLDTPRPDGAVNAAIVDETTRPLAEALPGMSPSALGRLVDEKVITSGEAHAAISKRGRKKA
jgi:hypothetical protein